MLSSAAHPNCTSAMSPMVPEKAESAPQKPWENLDGACQSRPLTSKHPGAEDDSPKS